MKKFWKSKINRRIMKSSERIGMTVFILFLTLSFGKISGTNSFFIDSDSVGENTFGAGYWIPNLTMIVDPENPDGENGFYKTAPCVTLDANINGSTGGIKIYYEFSDDGNPIDGGAEYGGTCIPIPDGDPTHFQAQAFNAENPDWKSNIVSENFKVSTGTKAGDVVINELMWMGGSGDEDDEWIELRNMTSHSIDLSNWRILNGGNGSGAGAHLEIPHGYSIKAGGYFLITKEKWDKTEINLSEDLDNDEGMTNKAGMNLKNSGEKLTLEDKNKNVIDVVWKDSCHWPAGWHGILLHMSMERNKIPGDGTKDSDWHTCIDQKCNEKTYWRHEGFNFGTPGKENLSANDPTDSDFDPASLEQKILDERDDSSDGNENTDALEISHPPSETIIKDPVSDPIANDPNPAEENIPPNDPIVQPSEIEESENLNTDEVKKEDDPEINEGKIEEKEIEEIKPAEEQQEQI